MNGGSSPQPPAVAPEAPAAASAAATSVGSAHPDTPTDDRTSTGSQTEGNPPLNSASEDVSADAGSGSSFEVGDTSIPDDNSDPTESGFMDFSGPEIGASSWKLGLANWRRGEYAAAAENFEHVALAEQSPWLVAAGAFWAARAHLYSRQPETVNRWLSMAANCSYTFYGILARRILGLPAPYRWTLDDADREALNSLREKPEGLAVLAAMQDGRRDRAEAMVRSYAGQGLTEVAHGALIYAEIAGLAQLAYRLQGILAPYGIQFDAAAYPIPRWEPEGGFTTDRALIYALMRQESNFNPRAVSRAGARGVMQLMPATARYVARLTGYSGGRLDRPEANMALGQRYIEYLLLDDSIRGDLFRLMVAWNGGPGNLERWQQRMDADEDALLFIESVPARETRVFIERVLANLWIYRDRLGLPSASLDALAAGQWPTYDAPEASPVEVAEHGVE